MPYYEYKCECYLDPIGRNVPISERNEQKCPGCNKVMKRFYSFEGVVWSPTRNGGHS